MRAPEFLLDACRFRELLPVKDSHCATFCTWLFCLRTSQIVHNLIDGPAALEDTLCVRGALFRDPGKGQFETGYSAGRMSLCCTSPRQSNRSTPSHRRSARHAQANAGEWPALDERHANKQS